MNITQFDPKLDRASDTRDVSSFTFCHVLYSNASCPVPSNEEARHIEALCAANAIVVDAIFSIALAFGLPGSVLTLITVSSLKSTPGTRYIACLAASDFISLTLASLAMYKIAAVDNLTENEEVIMNISYSFHFFSNWSLALICLERFVSVRFPMYKSQYYSNRATVLSVCIALGISFVPYCLEFVFKADRYLSASHKHVIFLITSVLVDSILPGIFILIFSVRTALELKEKANHRKSLVSQCSNKNTSQAVMLETRLTKMMFLTVGCFVVLIFPASIRQTYNIVYFVMDDTYCTLETTRYMFSTRTLFALTYLNNAVNFYVYMAFAQGFRKQCVRVICSKLTQAC
ncbi:FMRFamide receptor [Elysia marginata]|uniref:FMRFamide receptor n=1 Tax=Elysia marginata TaxID=1093978 RepID=A0AAV4J4J1_9GAST|nr:FMRFamide receptor [Elysia marginata]